MISVERNELRSIRVECAVSICLKFPSLYNKIRSKPRASLTDHEFTAAEILVGLIRQEPCIKYILDFYYKREGRL